MTDYSSLEKKANDLRRKYDPEGDSNFSGVVGNLLMIAQLSDRLHGDDKIEARRSSGYLEVYLDLLASKGTSKEVIRAEMRTLEGYLPPSVQDTSGRKHEDYISRLIMALTGNPLNL